MRNDLGDGFSFDGFTFDSGFMTEKPSKKKVSTYSAFDTDDHELKIMPINIGTLAPKFNRKGDYRWLSIRCWDKTEKEQIKWMERVKITQEPEALEMVASEFEITIRQLIHKTDNCFVCCAPQGHSRTKRHFISEVGKVLVTKLDCEFVKMFEDRHLSGSTYADITQDRGEIKIIGHSDKPVCIFIDDVCTSGMTMINCIRALKDSYTLIPIAWLYGKRKA